MLSVTLVPLVEVRVRDVGICESSRWAQAPSSMGTGRLSGRSVS